jgi:hypothetical protein
VRHRPDPRGHSPHSSTPRELCKIGFTEEVRDIVLIVEVTLYL